MDAFKICLIFLTFLYLPGCTSVAYVSAIEQSNKNKNVEIHHIGKVIDQHNNPVIGAKIQVRLGRGRESIMPHVLDKDKDLFDQIRDDELLELDTDINGQFKIDDTKGFGVVVKTIYKEGYISKINNTYTEYKKDDQDVGLPRIVTYEIWKSQGVEKVLYNPMGLRLKLIPEEYENGLPIQLITNIDSPYYDELGHLQIKCSNEGINESEDPRARYSWSCELSAVNGGIQELEDKSRQAAPEGGYIEELVYRKDKSDEDWKDGVSSNTIYFFNEGKNFGKATINLRAYKDRGIRVSISNIIINPNNSRNLESHGNNLTHIS